VFGDPLGIISLKKCKEIDIFVDLTLRKLVHLQFYLDRTWCLGLGTHGI
jgi:hypothetical protein